MGLEPRTTKFVRAETIHSLDRAANAIVKLMFRNGNILNCELVPVFMCGSMYRTNGSRHDWEESDLVTQCLSG